MNRICSVCGIEKQLDKFHKSKRHPLKRKLECAECTNAYLRNHYHTNTKAKPDFVERRINNTYKHKYNITYAQYLQMCRDRNNKCDICGTQKEPVGISKVILKDVLVIDHCHGTNKVRGLLCQLCNQGLGLFKDNIDNLTQAHLYLLTTETDKSEDSKEGF